ncbi:MAG: hypothetical protein Q8N01_07425 [Sulfuricurvum sp.]|nr:hypothetical protein [Sulfuricurvum sp.]MDP3021850.1 hypothetical protein [Sulfuricurvum sp.]MDP3120228.1 hypothetical protein [Sulfuricurvum sp.]
MLEKEKLQAVIELIDNTAVNPDVSVEYFIPGVLVTIKEGTIELEGPYIQFTYAKDGGHPWIQRMPLRQNYLQKNPEDLANFITFTLERFIEEVDSVESGAQ